MAGEHVDLELSPGHLDRDVLDRTEDRVAGIVDEDVDAAVLGDDIVDEALEAPSGPDHLHPAWARATAAASPMPEEAPVTRATWESVMAPDAKGVDGATSGRGPEV